VLHGQIDEARPCVIVTCVDRAGTPGLWPLKLPKEGEKDNEAWMSARAIAKAGMSYWVKKVWRGHAYIERRADEGYAPEPDFRRLKPFDELIHLAFGDHGIIRSTDHPVYRDLCGKPPKVTGDDDDPLS
jgi:hypothetical protein